MKIISWNVYGLGNPRGLRTLCDLVKMEAPDILFLQETRLKAHEFEVCKFKLGFVNYLVVDCQGRKGGLTVLWGRDIHLLILNYSHCHVDALIDDDPRKGSWFFIGIYGFPEVSQRSRTWDLLRQLVRYNGEAWIVIGDFNELLHHNEKWGGRPRPYWQISAFRDVVNDCCLRDMGFKGNKFTWSNRRGGSLCTSERLDRALANQPWWGKFLNASVIHRLEAYSDHVPIWVKTEGKRAALVFEDSLSLKKCGWESRHVRILLRLLEGVVKGE